MSSEPTNDERLAELAAILEDWNSAEKGFDAARAQITKQIEARNRASNPGDLDVPYLIKEIKRLRAEEDSRLKYVSHAVGQVLKAEEERDEAVAIISGPDCVACYEFRVRGDAGALKAKELQKARMKVVEAARKMRKAERHLTLTTAPCFRDEEAILACEARDLASNEFDAAVDALEEKAEADTSKTPESQAARRSAEEAPAPRDYKGPWPAAPEAVTGIFDAASLKEFGVPIKPMADADIQSFLREQYKQRQKREILEDKAPLPAHGAPMTVLDAAGNPTKPSESLAALRPVPGSSEDAATWLFLREQYEYQREILEEAHAQAARKEAQIAKQADMMGTLISQISDLRAQRDAALEKLSERKETT